MTQPLTAAHILANARSLAPTIAARSAEIEGLRRLPADLVADLRAAGMFRMGRARAKGGPQMTLRQHLEVIEVLAHVAAALKHHFIDRDGLLDRMRPARG